MFSKLTSKHKNHKNDVFNVSEVPDFETLYLFVRSFSGLGFFVSLNRHKQSFRLVTKSWLFEKLFFRSDLRLSYDVISL